MKIDGKEIASEIFGKQKVLIADLKKKQIIPHLVVLLVGEDPASKAYVRQKKLKGEAIGMIVTILEFDTDVSEEKLLSEIRRLNEDPTIHGIVIQQPLPDHINPQILVEATDPQKDVDGFHSRSIFTPPIAEAVLEVLKTIAQNPNDISNWLSNQQIAVVGKGETGGKPIADMLRALDISPVIIDSKTTDRRAILKKSSVIISCVGKKNIITIEDISDGVILMSIGMYRGEDGKLHGDYESEDIEDKAAWYTPVPGGIGPINVAMLLQNVIQSSIKNDLFTD